MWHAVVICKGLNFRSSPGTNNVPLAVLKTGDRMEVLSEDSGWYRVYVSSQGKEGYVSSSTSYVKLEHTTEADLVTVSTPYPTSRPVLLHRRAAAAFGRVLSTQGLSASDAQALCKVNSSFRSWDSQEALIKRYEAAIGTKWTSWNSLTEAQRTAARAAGFAYHPGFPKDAPHTHVGGGALDLQSPLPTGAVASLEANAFRKDTPGDAVHWAWHG